MDIVIMVFMAFYVATLIGCGEDAITGKDVGRAAEIGVCAAGVAFAVMCFAGGIF